MNALQIIPLLENGATWTSIFQELLAEFPLGKRTRMVLFRELERLFEVNIETLSIIGGWAYWIDGGYDDDELNNKLEGKLRLRGLSNLQSFKPRI
jgi:hypothetical protein